MKFKSVGSVQKSTKSDAGQLGIRIKTIYLLDASGDDRVEPKYDILLRHLGYLLSDLPRCKAADFVYVKTQNGFKSTRLVLVVLRRFLPPVRSNFSIQGWCTGDWIARSVCSCSRTSTPFSSVRGSDNIDGRVSAISTIFDLGISQC